MATAGKVSEGIHEKSETLIADEEVLFGQAVSYDDSDDDKGVRFEWDGSGHTYPAGVAVYDASAGTDDSRRYESNDVMEILKEGTINVRVSDQTTNTTVSISKGEDLYALPDGYIADGDTIGGGFSKGYFTMVPDSSDGEIAGSGYFGDPIATAKESTTTDGAVIKAELNLPEAN